MSHEEIHGVLSDVAAPLGWNRNAFDLFMVELMISGKPVLDLTVRELIAVIGQSNMIYNRIHGGA